MGMFLKNTPFNAKYFDLYNWWILQQSNNIPTRYHQMNSGGVEKQNILTVALQIQIVFKYICSSNVIRN